MTTRMPGTALLLIAFIMIVLVISATGNALVASPGWRDFFDNLHWTVGCVASAGLAWLGIRQVKGVEKVARRWFFLGLASYALGQVLWDIQVIIGWNPFPAPADLFYLMLGPLVIAGLLTALRHKLSPSAIKAALLDMASVSLGLIAIVLTLYLPRGGDIDAFRLAVLAAYPVFLLTAACMALLMALHLRLTFNCGSVLFFIGVLAEGLLWMEWNARVLEGTIEPGSVFNMGFTFTAMVTGLGAMLWRFSVFRDPRYERTCESILRTLPLLAVMAASAALILVNSIPVILPSVRYAVLLAMIAVLILATLRQSLLLGERDRMLEAERKIVESQARYEYLARHDPLTGLPNRLYLHAQLAEFMGRIREQGGELALLYIDLDRFKYINDSLGHAEGDTLLVSITQRMQGTVGKQHFFSRMGGDEFVMLAEASADSVAKTAQSLLDMFEEPFLLTGAREVFIGASIGISIFPRDADNVVDLVRNADTAMFQAKESGRRGYRFYSAAMTKAVSERLELEARLQRAVEREEFELYYQPQVCTSGTIIGVEALIRWRVGENAWIAPDRFIPVAEDTGLIVPLGEWVLKTACRQLAAWREQGLPQVRMAVNLSPRQMVSGDMVDQLRALLEQEKLSGEWLTLEITEGAIMDQEEKAVAMLHAFKSLGVRIAVDDFGTGHSSLVKLKSLPVDELKIDRAFVRDIPEDVHDMQIATAVIAMSQSLGLYVVAEGVETEAQHQFLHEQGCSVFQGYLFSKPLPVAEFEALLAAQPVWPCQAQERLEFHRPVRENTGCATPGCTSGRNPPCLETQRCDCQLSPT